MVKESKLEKYSSYAYMIFGFSLVATVVVLLFVVKPLWENNKSKQAIVKNKESKLNYLEDKYSKLERLSKKEQEVDSYSKKISSALPTYKDKSKLFMQFEGMKIDNNLNQATFGGGSDSVESENAITGVSEMSYLLDTKEVSYDTMKFFLIEYKNILRLLRIDRLDIKLSEEGKETINAQLDLKTFYRQLENGEQQ